MTTSKKAFGKFPRRLIHSAPTWATLTRQAKAVLMVLVTSADRAGYCTLWRKTIMELAGLKSLRQVQRGAQDLEDRGLIDRTPNYDASGNNTATTYHLEFDFSIDFAQMPAWVVKDGLWALMSGTEQTLYVAMVGLAQNYTCSATPDELRAASGYKLTKTVGEVSRKLIERGLVKHDEKIEAYRLS